MPGSKDTVRLIRIFVSSPGDVMHERQALDEVVERINTSESERTGLLLRLFKWEDDVVPRIGPPPQAVVDAQTPFCDIYLGIMSSRFGGDATRESGTEHEFRQALARFADTTAPWVLFYFNDDPPRPKSSTDTKQLTRVFEFREELEKKGIVGSYSGVRGTASGFFERVELHLRQLLQRPEFAVLRDGAGPRKKKAGRSRSKTSTAPVLPLDYLAWLQPKCATVDLFGLEPKHGSAARLHSIYVPLTTSSGVVDEGASSRKKPEREPEVRSEQRDTPALLLDRLAKESLYVTGAPGSGKSTFCRWVAWLVCEGRLPGALSIEAPDGYRETWPAIFAGRLPVLIRLRETWSALSRTSGARNLPRADFEAVLAQFVETNAEGLSAANFRAHLAQGSALLILDGVDEVPVRAGEGARQWSPRALVVSGLANACAAWTKAGNRVLVTSRPYGLAASAATSLGIAGAPLSDLDAPLRELLVRRWFQQLRPAGEADTYADGLVAHLAEYAWLEPLSVNPLLLTGMCIVYDEGGRLPQDKHELYTRIVSTVLNSRYRDNVEEREKARYRLQAIAYGMHTGQGLGEQRTTPAAEGSLNEIDRILRDYLDKSASKEEGSIAAVGAREELLSQSGLFLGRDDGKAGFYHLSFQEFLAGQRIVNLEEDLFRVFCDRAPAPEWHNTLSLLFSGLTRERAARLVSRIAAELGARSGPETTGLQTVTADALDILQARGIRLDEASEQICKEVFLQTMRSDAAVLVRCRLGATLGRIGDPRFSADAWWLPDDPLLGFIEIPAGPFTMGSDKDRDPQAQQDELPQHEVTLPAYFIARWPVTVAQFRAFVEDADNSGFEAEVPGALKGVPNHPMVMVSWKDALAYGAWLTGKLRESPITPEPLRGRLRDGRAPWVVTLASEAEWEKAARGTDARIYPWGNVRDVFRANVGDTGVGGTSAVGCFVPGASPYGVEDMSGNVWEWTRTFWSASHAAGVKPDKDRRVLRGGTFQMMWSMRAASRLPFAPVGVDHDTGLRLVVSPSSRSPRDA